MDKDILKQAATAYSPIAIECLHFIDGAMWADRHTAAKAIAFAEWLAGNRYIKTKSNIWIDGSTYESFTTEQLFEIFDKQYHGTL